MDTLVILMMAFGLFAVLMFILFYVYAKKYYNEKHLIDEDVDNSMSIDAVDINIDGSIITFDANNYHLDGNEIVTVIWNNTSKKGVVVQGNYHLDLAMGQALPPRLRLASDDLKFEYVEIPDKGMNKNMDEEMDFMPRKKNKYE